MRDRVVIKGSLGQDNFRLRMSAVFHNGTQPSSPPPESNRRNPLRRTSPPPSRAKRSASCACHPLVRSRSPNVPRPAARPLPPQPLARPPDRGTAAATGRSVGDGPSRSLPRCPRQRTDPLRETDGPRARRRRFPGRRTRGGGSAPSRVPSQPPAAPAAAEAPGKRAPDPQLDQSAGPDLAARLAAPGPPALQRALRRPGPQTSLSSGQARAEPRAGAAEPALLVGAGRLRRGFGEAKCAGRARVGDRRKA